MEDEMDSLLAQLGTGSWQIYHFLAISVAVNLLVPHTIVGPFLVPRHAHECRPSPGDMEFVPHENSTDADSCSYYVKLKNESLEEKICKEWQFDDPVFNSTVTSEFSLVCEKEYYRAYYQILYIMGILVGSPLNGMMADRYGRRRTFVWGTFMFVIVAILNCWLPNLSALLFFRFILGFGHPIILRSGYILAMEMAAPNIRTTIGTVLFLPWALTTCVWGGIAYLIRDWRYLLTAVSVPDILLFPVLWYMDESPRWLLVMGQKEKAFLLLKKAAKLNKTMPPTDEEMTSLANNTGDPQIKEEATVAIESTKNWKTLIAENAAIMFILLRTPRLRLATLIVSLNYFVLGFVYYGISISGANFDFDVFAYMSLLGIVEVPAYTILAPILTRFGRKKPISFFFLLCAVTILILPFIPKEMTWLDITLVLVGKLGISMAFQGNNYYGAELFPTEVRTRGTSTSFMLATVGSTISPFITDYLSLIYPWAPYALFGGASAVSALATLKLWETLGRPLPDTIVQLENADFSRS